MKNAEKNSKENSAERYSTTRRRIYRIDLTFRQSRRFFPSALPYIRKSISIGANAYRSLMTRGILFSEDNGKEERNTGKRSRTRTRKSERGKEGISEERNREFSDSRDARASHPLLPSPRTRESPFDVARRDLRPLREFVVGLTSSFDRRNTIPRTINRRTVRPARTSASAARQGGPRSIGRSSRGRTVP